MADEPKNLIHRDDMDMGDAEELVRHLQEEHPGLRVVFAGDVPDGQLPPAVREAAAQIEEAFQHSMLTGACLDCGAVMPNYPKPGEDMAADWQPAEGWKHFQMRGPDGLIAWQCPDCDAADEAEAAGDEDD